MEIKNEVYRTDELENAIDFLEQTVKFYQDKNFKHRFKWICISLHGALYGFAVCAIKGTNPIFRVLEKPSNKKINEFLSNYIDNTLTLDDPISKDHLPLSHLESFYQIQSQNNLLAIRNVIKKCQEEAYMLQNTESKILCIDDHQRAAIDKLIKYRNDFVHFKPKGFSIVGSIDDIMLPVLEVISFLALECNNILYRSAEERKRVEQSLKSLGISL